MISLNDARSRHVCEGHQRIWWIFPGLWLIGSGCCEIEWPPHTSIESRTRARARAEMCEWAIILIIIKFWHLSIAFLVGHGNTLHPTHTVAVAHYNQMVKRSDQDQDDHRVFDNIVVKFSIGISASARTAVGRPCAECWNVAMHKMKMFDILLIFHAAHIVLLSWAFTHSVSFPGG